MTRVKICGITKMEEVGYINKYLPEYAGFVFAESRRRVTPELAARLGAEMAPSVKKVGVFADHDLRLVACAAETAGLDAVQLHGNEDSTFIEGLRSLLIPGIEIWKAIRMDGNHMPDKAWLQTLDVDRLLLDTYVAGKPGGTGKSFDWRLVSQLGTALPVVLAGGLNSDNVSQAIRQASPYAVDTSSGVESGGSKEERKIRVFIDMVRGGTF